MWDPTAYKYRYSAIATVNNKYISKVMLNIVLNVICMHIDWWELVGVVNITVKGTLKSTSACAISEILDFKISPCSERFMLSSG